MNYRKISRQMTALALAVFLAVPGQVRAEENVAETLAETQAETPVETAPPETAPPETAPPVTEAPVTEAPVTEAPVTEAPVTETPATEAPATEAPAETLPGGESETQVPAETVPDETELVTEITVVTEGATEAETEAESETEKETEKKETELDREAILKDYVKSKPFSDPKERTLYDALMAIEGIPSFITQEMIEGAIHCQDEYGYPASVTIAQIIAEAGYGAYGPGGESGQGLSSLAYHHCNLFGIKGSGTAGSVSMKTWEMRANGTTYTTSAGFRAYYTYTECIKDRAELLKEYYSDLTNGVTDANTFAVQVGSRWATNVYYGKTLISIMKQYDLYRLDELTLIDWKAQEPSEATDAKTGGTKKKPAKKQETKTGTVKKNAAALPVSDGLGVFGSTGRLSGGTSLSAGRQLSGGVRLNAGGSPVLSAGVTLAAGTGTPVSDPKMLAEVNDWLKEMRMPFVQMVAISAGAMSWLL